MIFWVGISFEQSASTTYFRKVRSFLNEEDRAGGTTGTLPGVSPFPSEALPPHNTLGPSSA